VLAWWETAWCKEVSGAGVVLLLILIVVSLFLRCSVGLVAAVVAAVMQISGCSA
jgi:hypothetical protein